MCRTVATLLVGAPPGGVLGFARGRYMDEELMALIERAKERPISKDELRQQRESFAFGNLPNSSRSTREDVRRALELMEGGA